MNSRSVLPRSRRLFWGSVMPTRIWLKGIALTVLTALILAPWLLIAWTPVRHPSGVPANATRLLSLPPAFPIYTDFDGDHKPDKAELFSSGLAKIIEISFGNSRRGHLRFNTESSDQGELLTLDINHDNYPDLVWVSGAQPRKTKVWLGDGEGNFEVAKDSESYAAEINALLGTSDNSGSQIGRGSNKLFRALTSITLRDLAFIADGQVRIARPTQFSLTSLNQPHVLTVCLSVLSERGPPSNLS